VATREIVPFLVALLSRGVAYADTLGLSAPSADAPAPPLAALPAFVPYALALAALAILSTAARRRPREHRADGVTTVRVRPPSQRGEAGMVLRIGLAIALGALAVAVASARASRPLVAPVAVAGKLAPFQIAYRDVAPSLQESYRTVRVGLVAAERRRAASGRWPDVAALAAEGVAPFAPSPSAANERVWTLHSDDAGTTYVGVPVPPSDAPALLIAIVDPARGDAPGDAHRLPDGTTVRVSLWFRPGGVALAAPSGVVTKPETERWMQIVDAPGN
jgi:hypothetical protein